MSYTNAYISPSPGKFPIIAWGGFSIEREKEIRNNFGTDSKEFKDFLKKEIDHIKGMGFSVATRPLYDSYRFVRPSLVNSGLSIIGSTPNSEKQLESIENFTLYLDRFLSLNNIDEIVSWLIVDEPNYKQLSLCRDIKNVLIDRIYSRKPMNFWINCLCDVPKDATNTVNPDDSEMPGYLMTYPEYLGKVQEIFTPQVWSFDQYPLRIKRGEIVVQDSYFETLRYYMLMSKRTGRPFWAFCQCLTILCAKNGNTHGIATPVPSYQYMRFEAFSSLAYGAQGIEYWSLIARKDTTEVGEIKPRFGAAPLDDNGNIFDATIYNAIKELNSEIEKGSHIFLKAVPEKVRHTGKAVWNDVEYYEPGESFGPLHNLVSTNKGVIISWLKNGSDNYLLIMNHDPSASQIITLYIDSRTTIWRISLTKEPEMSVLHEGDITSAPQSVFYKRTLEAGGYLLLKW